MASSSQVRAWWKGYQRNPSRYVVVNFPMPGGRTVGLRVADKSKPIWVAVTQIMATEPYLFRDMNGGTYNPRTPGSVSLHTYALALDLNPKQNPHKNPLTTDMPQSFIKRMEGIRANGKQAITWGGRWTSPSKPDAMHYQINVAPADCRNVTWDRGGVAPKPPPDGGDVNWKKPGDPVEDVSDMKKVHQWQGNEVLTDKDIDYVVAGSEEVDWRWKFAVTKAVNVMMK
jgi:D-alanyl-D-alanine carboxypeptidase